MPSGKPFDLSKVNLIIQAYRSGLNCGQIAKQFKSSKETIRSLLKRHGIKIRKASPFGVLVNKKDLNRWAKEYEDGLNTHQIADKYGVATSTVLKHLKVNGVKLREHKKRFVLSEDQVKKLIQEYQDNGKSLKECAGIFNISHSTCSEYLNKNNINTSEGRNNLFRTPEQEQIVLDLYNEHRSVSKVSSTLETSNDPVIFVLKKHGIEVDNISVKFKESYREDISKLYFSGRPLKEIADSYGINSGTLLLWLHKWKFAQRTLPQQAKKYRVVIGDNVITLKSSWELYFANHLESEGLSWKYESVSYDTPHGRYLPDFFIYNGDKITDIYEVKGRFLGNLNKFDYVQKKNPDIKFHLIRSKDLSLMNVFNKKIILNVKDYSVSVEQEIKRTAQSKLYRYQEKEYSIQELADKFNISRYLIMGRLGLGWDIERAVETPTKKSEKRMISYGGKRMSLKELSLLKDIPYKTLHARIVRMNWSIDKAANTPITSKKLQS